MENSGLKTLHNLSGPLGIIAGGGSLPFEIVHILTKQNIPFVIAALDGFADTDLIRSDKDFSVSIGFLGTFIDRMKAAGVRDLLMAGKVQRPGLRQLKTDAIGAAFLAKVTLKASMLVRKSAMGDNALLEAVKDELAKHGFRLHGIGDVTRTLFVEEGVLGDFPIDHRLQRDLTLGIEIAKEVGRLDIGQAVVVHEGEVLAVEAAEGTDAMLQRLKHIERVKQGGVFVKVAKPQQDRRLDLPTVGLQTIESAIAAGLSTVAIESNATLLLQRDECVEAANKARLCLLGVK